MDQVCHFVLGTRPEIVKLSPVLDAWTRAGYRCHIVHTGQHYDSDMDTVFFHDLDLPDPDDDLMIGSSSPSTQTAKIVEAVANVLERDEARLVVVQGDTNSTLGAALAAATLKGTDLAHVESGCRSFNRRMPEELNRIVTDHLSHVLFAATSHDLSNLDLEGLGGKAYLVGSTGVEACVRNSAKARLKSGILNRLGVQQDQFGLATIHRMENTAEKSVLTHVLAALSEISKKIPIVFPVHPRTARVLRELGITWPGDIQRTPPLGYLDFLALLSNAGLVLTDSGGVQEEAAALGVRCFTLRDETEWTYTVDAGINTLVSTDPNRITTAVKDFLEGDRSVDPIAPRWPADKPPSEAITHVLSRRIGIGR